MLKRYLLTILLLVSIASPAWAQASAEGTIRGVVKDQQGAVLPGVTITATSPSAAGARTAVTGGDGTYRLLNLPPGDYTLVAELSGFSKAERSGVMVRSGLNIAVDIALTVGNLAETVQVVGETPMLEVQKPVQAVNISGELQRALPLRAAKTTPTFWRSRPA